MDLQNKEIKIAEALAVCAEVTNTQFSEAAFSTILSVLLEYKTDDVLSALNRCIREMASKLTLASILQRMPTSLPSSDEVWGQMMAALEDENLTIVVPEIAQLAAGMGASALLKNGDKIGARMAFKQSYERLSLKYSDAAEEIKWVVSEGYDKKHKEHMIEQAVIDGKLKNKEVKHYLPNRQSENLLIENKVTEEDVFAGELLNAQQHIKALLNLLNKNR